MKLAQQHLRDNLEKRADKYHMGIDTIDKGTVSILLYQAIALIDEQDDELAQLKHELENADEDAEVRAALYSNFVAMGNDT